MRTFHIRLTTVEDLKDKVRAYFKDIRFYVHIFKMFHLPWNFKFPVFLPAGLQSNCFSILIKFLKISLTVDSICVQLHFVFKFSTACCNSLNFRQTPKSDLYSDRPLTIAKSILWGFHCKVVVLLNLPLPMWKNNKLNKYFSFVILWIHKKNQMCTFYISLTLRGKAGLNANSKDTKKINSQQKNVLQNQSTQF